MMIHIYKYILISIAMLVWVTGIENKVGPCNINLNFLLLKKLRKGGYISHNFYDFQSVSLINGILTILYIKLLHIITVDKTPIKKLCGSCRCLFEPWIMTYSELQIYPQNLEEDFWYIEQIGESAIFVPILKLDISLERRR